MAPRPVRSGEERRWATLKFTLGCGLLAAAILAPTAPAASGHDPGGRVHRAVRQERPQQGARRNQPAHHDSDHRHAAPRRRCSSTHTTLRFPKGAVVNARFFPKCKLAALRASGAAGLPAGVEDRLRHGASALAPPIVRPREREGHALQRRRRGPQPVRSSSTRFPDLGPVMTLARRAAQRAAELRTATCSTRRCRRSRRCRARPTPR